MSDVDEDENLGDYHDGYADGLSTGIDSGWSEGCHDCIDKARAEGAAVAFGLMGMAEAIQETVQRNRCRPCTCGFFTRAGEVCLCCGRYQPSFRDAEERAKCPEAWIT